MFKTARQTSAPSGDAPASAAAALALRNPEPPLRYGFLAKAFDARAGRRDARSDLGNAPGGATTAMVWQLWLARARHTFQERDHREFLTAQASAARRIAELQRLQAELVGALHALQGAERTYEAMPDSLAPDSMLQPGPGEQFEDAETLRARRRTAHDAARGQVGGAVTAAAGRLEALQTRRAEVAADLEYLFSVACRRSDRLREHSSRRASTYLHAYLKAAQRLAAGQHPDLPTQADAHFEAPQWTTLPCPWTQLRDQSDRRPDETEIQ